ncbi:MAG: carbohydrate kinase [Verrucomicrobia bacterium]|nr:carbohydrate kinase [Verrucomicrobiota bacterium]MCG2680767.1 xylulose kinase [Kiritimatiellia bacterium]MBU4246905.1 carbohydrate kinase [Verrucomicrobiota bacterium]MBU4291293.1 carbohydrate kinase [Verrucomicrobiota bacterium]MBU4429950.1 carbohydrate kinase [Verrucomicrobiota bacterium]
MKTRPAKNRQSIPAPLFLGLDSSTQGLEATVIDAACRIVAESAVQFDADLPAFKTQGGVHRHPDGLTVTSPPLMWVAALDLLLARMKKAKMPLDRIAAISGSGQQHGSVYLRPGTDRVLKNLAPARSLAQQLRDVFSVNASPIWMDSSTTRQCQERDAALGGPQAVAELTGSRSYERFTGNQIAKIVREHPEFYRATERIALVSSFMASLLIGDYAPIEPGDGAGMNLMDIRSRRWSKKALDCTAPGLAAKLGAIVPSHSIIGILNPYYVARYGFSPQCRVTAFSGDNPNSLAALGLAQSGEVAISLGTSDTVFGALSEPRPSATEGHIFGNPINPKGYMALVCYMNGSLTRESVRDSFAGRSWKRFEDALSATRPGNGGKIGFFFKEPEITPPVRKPGIFRFGADNRPTDAFRPEENIRAVVEGQFLSMRLHGRNIGLVPKKILATGGASVNRSILRVMADVFGVPVYIGSQANSASLGSAYRTLHGWHCVQARRFLPFTKVIKPAECFEKTFDPDKTNHRLYTALLVRYAKLERWVTDK